MIHRCAWSMASPNCRNVATLLHTRQSKYDVPQSCMTSPHRISWIICQWLIANHTTTYKQVVLQLSAQNAKPASRFRILAVFFTFTIAEIPSERYESIYFSFPVIFLNIRVNQAFQPWLAISLEIVMIKHSPLTLWVMYEDVSDRNKLLTQMLNSCELHKLPPVAI